MHKFEQLSSRITPLSDVSPNSTLGSSPQKSFAARRLDVSFDQDDDENAENVTPASPKRARQDNMQQQAELVTGSLANACILM